MNNARMDEGVPLKEMSFNDEPLLACRLRIAQIQSQEEGLLQRLRYLTRLWESRKSRIDEELSLLQLQRERAEDELNFLLRKDHEEPLLGPACLEWVDGLWFSRLCMVVIVVNLITIGLEMSFHVASDMLWYCDQGFLLFYVVELTLKALLYERGLLIGRFTVVWWNWLDLVIVVSGLFDQWLLPLFSQVSEGAIDSEKRGGGHHAGVLRMLRLLRVIRVIRVVKIIRLFMKSDLSWTERAYFQAFITSIIALNAIVMGLELNYKSPMWMWVEQAMLVIYTFEMSVRLKRWGIPYFFVHPEDWAWNNLDFSIVIGGIFEQWFMPLTHLVRHIFFGHVTKKTATAGIMPVLRIMRLLRILRLLRLLKSVKPLYKLAVGVVKAMQSMQWVCCLTLVLLYAAAIMFTSLVGHNQIPGGGVPEDAQELYYDVWETMFLLFRVMNGDSKPIEPLYSTVPLKLMCVGFVIVSNWAVLAILTAVVSENMITATQDHEATETRENERLSKVLKRARLHNIFKETDKDCDGKIDHEEFNALLSDRILCQELVDVSGLRASDLKDLFIFISAKKDGIDDTEHWFIEYNDFIEKLLVEGRDVSERSVFRLERNMRLLEQRLTKRFCRGDEGGGGSIPVREDSFRGGEDTSPEYSGHARGPRHEDGETGSERDYSVHRNGYTRVPDQARTDFYDT
eukprot:NODE_1560_length_2437_cov_16.032900.p1 GENE.NODE_1560_length_2437_cov_16.032900~~NODE_1560_length_2437_cov_16.032900.p1  ORF type:complete len:683 (+),score=154.93 NODE_1560_length_2437_cov_16.032900:96-2144(+)